MSAHAVLLDLLGSVALLIWATRMVKTGILRAYEDRLRVVLRRAAGRPVTGLFAGIGVATALQSSTAASLLLVSFAERGLIALAPALAVMLGADIGSTLVVQALSVDLSAVIPVLMIAGVLLFMNGRKARTRQLGRVAIGLGLMILSLKLIVAASGPMRQSESLSLVLDAVASDPIITLLLAAGLTWLVHSSVAVVLLIMSLASSGVVEPDVALVLVLGANVGAGLIPLGLTAGAGAAAKRILYGNLAFRATGALAAIALLPLVTPWLVELGFDPARLVANGHTGFNLLLALVFLPLVGIAAKLLIQAVPEPETVDAPGRPVHLDPELLDRPRLAIGAASREVMRLADLVEVMLRDAILAFEAEPKLSAQQIAAQDNAVDDLQESIKLYLTALTRKPLEDEESRRCFDLIVFTTNLEHIGDIIDKSLMLLAEKKARERFAFSDDGWAEIVALHRMVLEQLRLAVTVFVTKDVTMARDLVARKDEIRGLEKEAFKSHLDRLRLGTAASIESSAVHLDVIRDLKQINGYVASVAYPILEEKGVLRGSRLRSA